MRWIILSIIFAVAGFAGYGTQYAAHPAPTPVLHSGDGLTAIRRFCVSYYEWRETQPEGGVPSLDQICFDTQEMIP